MDNIKKILSILEEAFSLLTIVTISLSNNIIILIIILTWSAAYYLTKNILNPTD